MSAVLEMQTPSRSPDTTGQVLPRRGRSWGLQVKLFLLPVAALSLVLLFSGVLVSQIFLGNNNERQIHQLDTLSDVMLEIYNHQVNTLDTVMKMTVTDRSLYDGWFAAQMQDYAFGGEFLAKARRLSQADAVVMVAPDGTIVLGTEAAAAGHGVPYLTLLAPILNHAPINSGQRDSELGRMIQKQLYYDGKTLRLIVAGPIFDVETVVGAIAFEIQLDSRFLQTQKQFFGSSFELTLTHGDRFIASTASPWAIPHDVIGPHFDFEGDIGGKRYRSDFRTLGDTDYYLCLSQDMTQNLAAGRTMIQTTLATFIIAIGVVALLTAYAVRRILRLKDAILGVMKGGLQKKISVDGKDELGVVAQAFNEMVTALNSTTVSKSYLDNIIRSMRDTLIVVDNDGLIANVNDATLKLLGYQADELIGQPASIIIHDDFLPGFKAAQFVALDIEENAETAYRAKDGKDLPMLFSVAVLRDADGAVQGLVFVAQDISERKRAEQALVERSADLERTNKELDQFAYVVSHDLKAPLRAIANLSQWIEEDLGEGIAADTRKQMDLLRGRVQRMEGLINGILDYSRIGRTAVQLEDVDTQALLKDLTDGLPVPPGYTITVAPAMPRLTTSRVRLGQVFGNLLSNAIKYRSRDDGHVEVTVRDAGDYYEFAVADDGPGIAPEYHEKVFIIFQTLAARDKVEGTGIGLTLVKKIVEEQGGHITLESAEGKGSIFRFTWPKQIEERAAA